MNKLGELNKKLREYLMVNGKEPKLIILDVRTFDGVMDLQMEGFFMLWKDCETGRVTFDGIRVLISYEGDQEEISFY